LGNSQDEANHQEAGWRIMVRKYVKLLDGNMDTIAVLDCDNRFCPDTCLRKAEKEVLKLNDKRVQFMQLLMGKNSLVAKPVFRPVQITPKRH